MLKIFWESHDPTHRAWSRQYASIIFFHDEQQRLLATESREQEEARRKKKVHTDIKPYNRFFLAEEYHQKYWLQGNKDYLGEFQVMYPDFAGIIYSTAAARVNGYLGRNGTCELLREEWSSYGLSPEANKKLMDMVCFVPDKFA